MRNFKAGDKVVCKRPVDCLKMYKGKVATVLGVDGNCLMLSYPFMFMGYYTEEQFDLVSPLNLENK